MRGLPQRRGLRCESHRMRQSDDFDRARILLQNDIRDTGICNGIVLDEPLEWQLPDIRVRARQDHTQLLSIRPPRKETVNQLFIRDLIEIHISVGHTDILSFLTLLTYFLRLAMCIFFKPAGLKWTGSGKRAKESLTALYPLENGGLFATDSDSGAILSGADAPSISEAGIVLRPLFPVRSHG